MLTETDATVLRLRPLIYRHVMKNANIPFYMGSAGLLPKDIEATTVEGQIVKDLLNTDHFEFAGNRYVPSAEKTEGAQYLSCLISFSDIDWTGRHVNKDATIYFRIEQISKCDAECA